MPVVWTGYGAAAYEALRGVVGEVKGGDPLAPVSVLVPTHLCGVIARRILAHGVAGRPGVAGLSVLTVDRLAELIAAPALTGAGRRPGTSPVIAAAWRRALAEDPGVFGPVMAHPATVQALAAAHRELREVAAGELDAIAGCGEPIASDLVRLHRRVTGLLAADWYDTTDLRRAAATVLRGEPRRGREIGEVVLFLPQELAPSATALLRELPAAGLRVVAGRTGEERADAGVVEAVRGLGAGDGDVPVVAPVADLTALGLTLGLELADDLPRQGRFGTGVLVAPLGSAIGLDADVVFVVGLAEELVPGRLREDALLPERVRALAPGQLAPLRDRLDRQHRQLLAALAAAPERIVSFPRGDLRRSSTRLPSRWLLPSLRVLSGRPGCRPPGGNRSAAAGWTDRRPTRPG